MNHLLLDVNIVVDLCLERVGSANAKLAIALAESRGWALWVYAGSVQTLEYVVAAEVFDQALSAGEVITRTAARARARHLLQQMTAGYQWLAALAAEGAVFAEEDPEDAQLQRALARFPDGSSLLLTRDKPLLKRGAAQTLTPEAFIEQQGSGQPSPPRRLDFIDLAAQQQHLRPQLERNLHRVLHHGQFILGPEVRELEARLAILTSDDALAQACREIRVHGQSQRYVHTRIGVGGRMDTLQCAIVLAKLDRFDQEIAQRQAVARRYHELLATDTHGSTRIDEEPIRVHPCPSVARVHPCSSVARVHPCKSVANPLPWPQADRTSVFAQYTLRVPDRAALQARLQAAGIPTAVHYPVPLNEQPAYAHLCCPDCTPVARQMAREVMSLPMHPDLTEADQDRIVSTIAADAA